MGFVCLCFEVIFIKTKKNKKNIFVFCVHGGKKTTYLKNRIAVDTFKCTFKTPLDIHSSADILFYCLLTKIS